MTRSFKIILVKRVNGCKTKYNVNSRFINNRPINAAKKAVTSLCRLKRIHGACALHVIVQETTRNSKKKLYSYHVNRKKYKTPVVVKDQMGQVLYKRKYDLKAKKKKMPVKIRKGIICKQSRGPMKGKRR